MAVSQPNALSAVLLHLELLVFGYPVVGLRDRDGPWYWRFDSIAESFLRALRVDVSALLGDGLLRRLSCFCP